MYTPLTFGTTVRAGGYFGVIVSVSRIHYGVKFESGEVNYFAHALVNV